jgi:hypothetical protein
MLEAYTSFDDPRPMKSVTEDFIESFKDQEEFSGGFFGIMYITRKPPGGVDADNPEVKKILARLDDWKAKEKL